MYVVRIIPNFDRLVPLGKAEVAVIVTGFGDVPIDNDEFFDIHSFSSQVYGEELGDDDTGLNEKCAEIAVVIPPEIRKGARVAWRGWNNKAFCGTIGQMPENGMFAMPYKQPSATFKHGIAHFVDFGVV